MTTALDALKKCSVIVADSGDLDAIAKWRPQDTTTNPSLLLSAAQDPRFLPLVQRAFADGKGQTEATVDHLFVAFHARFFSGLRFRAKRPIDEEK